MITLKEAETFVLIKMLSDRYIGGHQLLSENTPKGKPKEDRKMIMKAVRKLANKGFFLMKRKHYGIHISLDPKKMKEIREYLAGIRE